ncbi:hypothetical protein [Azospirillum baldaniorum]|uniref:hypothetical protein n=1 Tax=Azospirillum baldaniorum TaxID=1064539 RepID=UPI0011A08DAC|nr:hypothetical protein [Azospirillum baldaniorum]
MELAPNLLRQRLPLRGKGVGFVLQVVGQRFNDAAFGVQFDNAEARGLCNAAFDVAALWSNNILTGKRIARHKGVAVFVTVDIEIVGHYRAFFTELRKFSEYPSAHLNSRTTSPFRYT